MRKGADMYQAVQLSSMADLQLPASCQILSAKAARKTSSMVLSQTSVQAEVAQTRLVSFFWPPAHTSLVSGRACKVFFVAPLEGLHLREHDHRTPKLFWVRHLLVLKVRMELWFCQTSAGFSVFRQEGPRSHGAQLVAQSAHCLFLPGAMQSLSRSPSLPLIRTAAMPRPKRGL